MGYLLEFSDPYKDRELFEELVTDLKRDQGDFFVFVGAGLSHAASRYINTHCEPEFVINENWEKRFPLWDELADTISQNIARKVSEAEVVEFRDNHDNIDVAQYLKEIDPLGYDRVLRNAFALRESELPKLIPPTHESLLRVTKGRTIVTTNYDELFEFYYTRLFGTRPDVAYTVKQLRDLEERSNNTKLIKLHGTIADLSTIVLTREDYAVAWQERKPMFEYIENRLQKSTCVFVGYSMRDSNFNFIYDQVRYFSGFRAGKLNYCIVSSESTPTSDMARSYWGMRGLQMIALKNWDSLDGLLQELSARIGSEE